MSTKPSEQATISPFWGGGSSQRRGRHRTILPTTVLPTAPPCFSQRPKPAQLRMGGRTRFCSKDWIHPRSPIACQSHPNPALSLLLHLLQQPPSFRICPFPGNPFCSALTLPLTSSSVASHRVTPCSSRSRTSLASFLAQHR